MMKIILKQTDLEIAVGVLPFDDDGRILDPGLLAALIVKRFDAEAAPFGPARVHAQQHGSPVLRFGTACTGMDGDNGVAAVVRTAQQHLDLHFSYMLFQGGGFVEEGLNGLVVSLLFGHFVQVGTVFECTGRLFVFRQFSLELGFLFLHRGRLGGIVPEVLRILERFDFAEALFDKLGLHDTANVLHLRFQGLEQLAVFVMVQKTFSKNRSDIMPIIFNRGLKHGDYHDPFGVQSRTKGP
jgi:hypothetical protein